MKKIMLCIMAASLSFTCPLQSNAASFSAPITSTDSKTILIESEEAKSLLLRLEEIKTMDKSALKSSEKKVLRKEVRSIKSRLSELGGGIYISASAIIIILLLIILL